MPIHIHLANLIIRKTAIDKKVVGGFHAFRSSLLFQGNKLNQEDDEVFSLTRMNPDEFDIDTLIALGLDYNESTYSSSDFTIVTRYGGMLWEVDWLEHDTTRDILKSSSNDLDLMMEIKKKRFRLSDLSINPRNAVHWESKGLFLNKKPEGTWQLLDLTEATWILIVQKLRDFNFKLELISDLKDNFLNARIEHSDKSSKDKIK
jgi:hypothetical protein